tara:strand:- start:292 stop:1194 length:903 start_codon:yes stop_codon:yes gene_type:complete
LKNSIKISACIITYNHEAYIKDCLEGAISQILNCEYEIVIGEDFSTDATLEICKEYAEKYPNLIRLLPREKNLGMMGNWMETLKDCQGKYIALCEGDDYWTDPLKLQKQVDFLEENEDYVLCFHKVDILKPSGEIVEDFITNVPKNYESISTLARFGNYIHTPSVVYRNILNSVPFELKEAPFGDFFLYMMLAQHGNLYYIKEVMGVYRYNVGVISNMSEINIANNNVKLYSCMFSYFDNEELKKIILERQIEVVTRHYNLIHSKYSNYFVSNHLVFRLFKFFKINYKNPKKILAKLRNK